jgi:hypothetical protein
MKHPGWQRPAAILKSGLLLLATCGVLLVSGCAAVRPAPAVLPEAVARPGTVTVTPLQYIAWAQSASVAALQAERARLANLANPADLVLAVQHAIVLGLSAIADEAGETRALALLAAVEGRVPTLEENPEYRTLARLLRSYLLQRQDLRLAAASNGASRQEIDDLQQSNRQLQDKIDALTTIEQQLIERELQQEP